MKNYSLTCKTENCINKDIPIEFATDAEQFVCGPCGQSIASVVEIPMPEESQANG
jgi:hypothetical protein